MLKGGYYFQLKLSLNMFLKIAAMQNMRFMVQHVIDQIIDVYPNIGTVKPRKPRQSRSNDAKRDGLDRRWRGLME
jgi:hypothetical protein